MSLNFALLTTIQRPQQDQPNARQILLSMSVMERLMLRKMGIVVAVVALGLTAVQTDAFARGGGGGGGGFGGGHVGSFGGARIGGFGGAHIGGMGGAHVGVPHGGFATRNSGLRFRGDRFGRGGFGGGYGWGDWCDDWPYDYNGYYGYCY